MDEVAVLPVAPWLAAALGLVLLVGTNVPPGAPPAPDGAAGPSPVAHRAVAVLALAAAAVAVVLTRTGPRSELDNPVPALVVGLGWPALFVVPALVGPAARRARPAPARVDGRHDDVRPAVLAAAAVVTHLAVVPAPTGVGEVGTAVAAYALVMTAAAVAFGRAAVAARAEVLGLLARWSALGPRLTRWAPPRGALAVLAVVLGGAWFERLQRTAHWGELLPTRTQTVLGLAGGVAVAAGAALLLAAVTRTRATAGTPAAVLLPLAAAAAVAGVVRRTLISAQLVAGGPVEADPLGVAGGQGLALGVVAAGGAAAAAVLARRAGPGAARLPGLGVVLLVTGVSGALVLQP